MKQNLILFPNFSLGQNMCAIFGTLEWTCVSARGLAVRAPAPKTIASVCEGPPRSALLGTGSPREAPFVKKMPPVKVRCRQQHRKRSHVERLKVLRIPSKLICSVED